MRGTRLPRVRSSRRDHLKTRLATPVTTVTGRGLLRLGKVGILHAHGGHPDRTCQQRDQRRHAGRPLVSVHPELDGGQTTKLVLDGVLRDLEQPDHQDRRESGGGHDFARGQQPADLLTKYYWKDGAERDGERCHLGPELHHHRALSRASIFALGTGLIGLAGIALRRRRA